MKIEELNNIIEKSKFLDIELEQPTPLILIKDKVILTENSFMTISGLPKARKTTFMQLFIASALTQKPFFEIKANIKKGEKIILIDTEQSNFDFYKQNKFLKKLIENKKLPECFSAYLFREYDPEIILQSIYTICETERPKLLFIDNLTELCMDPNNILEAKKVIQFLKMITAKFNLSVVCLLHLSKSNNFTLGNLGSYADRGAQSVLKVTLDRATDTSTLECNMLRSDAHFEPISIQYDNEKNTYTTADNPGANTPEKKKKFSMDNFTEDELKARLDILFEMQKEYVYNAIVENLKNIFGVGLNAVKQTIIPYLIFKKYIINKDKIYTYYKH